MVQASPAVGIGTPRPAGVGPTATNCCNTFTSERHKMLTAKSTKVTFVLDAEQVAVLPVPEQGKNFVAKIQVNGTTLNVNLSAKTTRRVVALVKINPSGFSVIIQGKMTLWPAISVEEAGMVAQPKTKKDASVEPAAA